jgi:hypothetical protein
MCSSISHQIQLTTTISTQAALSHRLMFYEAQLCASVSEQKPSRYATGSGDLMSGNEDL